MQENVAKTAAEWVFVAKSLVQLPDGQSQAMRCMARAEELAHSVADWLVVATAWQQDFDDPDKARWHMSIAEHQAKEIRSYNWEQTLLDWISISGTLERIFNDSERGTVLDGES